VPVPLLCAGRLRLTLSSNGAPLAPLHRLVDRALDRNFSAVVTLGLLCVWLLLGVAAVLRVILFDDSIAAPVPIEREHVVFAATPFLAVAYGFGSLLQWAASISTGAFDALLKRDFDLFPMVIRVGSWAVSLVQRSEGILDLLLARVVYSATKALNVFPLLVPWESGLLPPMDAALAALSDSSAPGGSVHSLMAGLSLLPAAALSPCLWPTLAWLALLPIVVSTVAFQSSVLAQALHWRRRRLCHINVRILLVSTVSEEASFLVHPSVPPSMRNDNVALCCLLLSAVVCG
jgi:hypothetical protein